MSKKPPAQYTQKFEEALAWFQERVPMTKAEYNKLSEWAKKRAFTVAHVSLLDVVQSLYDAIQDALESGTTFSDFRKAVQDDFAAAWISDTRTDDQVVPRLKVIFQNNVQSAYNAGRWHKMTDPDIIASRPYWAYDTVQDGNQTKICQALNGICLPAGDPFFRNRWPPLHHYCRTSVITLSQKQAEAMGITEKSPDTLPQEGFGASPDSSEWEPLEEKYNPELWKAYEAKTQKQ